ncbi:RNA polymerase sigma factor [Providencia stuartii]|uniref:RNA polymerase sigma factor n=1 Tax=Providencia stuartii TaxID=588 RepID=UPI0004F60447|nr:RNA polymerase sigma factor [Providencia stuartii]AIN62288.1 RNA polymerase sigma factor, sigma-70 family protein [Providencia stuartii]AMG68514.1 RNA polymerase sigma factor [Providencia stuartii]MBG5897916.1 RNA polymerase sigma factor [Providencia stuartii]MBK1420157.1 RNA polymerase sigma factor [Providencia stuartii]MTC69207.1 sigma-70 family RNA polymerase sigma factor [Providencia stuartii]
MTTHTPSIENSDLAEESQLLQQHAPSLFRYILARTPDSDIANEILQDVFVHTIETYRCQTLQFPRAFMYTLAQRNIANFYRRQHIEAEYQRLLVEPEPEWNLETQLVVEEQLQLLSEQLAKLPENMEQAYLLAQFEGMTYQQIATQLKVSPNSIKYYLQVARKVLQKELTETYLTH